MWLCRGDDAVTIIVVMIAVDDASGDTGNDTANSDTACCDR